MAARIPHREEYRHVTSTCLLERFSTPFEPVDGVFSVLKQVGRGCGCQSVDHHHPLAGSSSRRTVGNFVGSMRPFPCVLASTSSITTEVSCGNGWVRSERKGSGARVRPNVRPTMSSSLGATPTHPLKGNRHMVPTSAIQQFKAARDRKLAVLDGIAETEADLGIRQRSATPPQSLGSPRVRELRG